MVATLKGAGSGPVLMFNGHIDTVPPGEMPDPFTPEVIDGKLFGRGSVDMKGGIAGQLAAMIALKRAGVRLSGDLVFTGVIAEEDSTSLGSLYVIEKGPKPDMVVVSEPNLLPKLVARQLAMGLAPGGRMRQQTYADPYGPEAWETSVSSRCFVTLINARHWREITGEPPPTTPPSAIDYANAGLPWFDFYREAETLAGSPELAAVKSMAEMATEKNDDRLSSEASVDPAHVIQLGQQASSKSRAVRESGF